MCTYELVKVRNVCIRARESKSVCELARKWSVGAQLSRAEETALPHAVQAARAAARKAFSPPRSDDTHTQREDSPFVTFELCVPL